MEMAMDRRGRESETWQESRRGTEPSEAFRTRLYGRLRAEMLQVVNARRSSASRRQRCLKGGLAAAALLLAACSISFWASPDSHDQKKKLDSASLTEKRSEIPSVPWTTRKWVIEKLGKARTLYGQKHHERAAGLCQNVLEKSDSAECLDGFLYLKAQALLQQGRASEACKTLARLIREYPYSRFAGEAGEQLAGLDSAAARALGFHDEPEIDLEERAQEALANFAGNVWQRDVLSRFARSFPEHPLSPAAVLRLGRYLQDRGEVAEAARLFGQVTTHWPGSDTAAQAQSLLVTCYRRRGHLSRASEECADLLARYPSSPFTSDAMLELGNHWYAVGNFQAAAQWFLEVVRRFPSDALAENIHFKIGQCYGRDRDYFLSALKFEEFARDFPESVLCPKALACGGEAYRQAREIRRAYDLYQTCIALFPNSIEAHQARTVLTQSDFQTLSGHHTML